MVSRRSWEVGSECGCGSVALSGVPVVADGGETSSESQKEQQNCQEETTNSEIPLRGGNRP